jgi:Tol biopolymer transport system component
MAELREVFEMVTRNTEPDQDAWQEQERRQRRAARTRKLGTIGLVAALIAAGIVFAVTNGGDEGATVQQPAGPAPSASGGGTPGEQPLGLAIVGLDGSVQELGLPTDAWMPDLSADGTRLLFLSDSVYLGFCGGCSADAPPHDRLADIRVGEPSGRFIYLEGVGLRRVQQPVWSPAADRIAFVGVDAGGNADIYVADIPDRGAIVEIKPQRLTTDPAVDEFPAWSPDGSTIVYDSGGATPLDASGFSLTQEIWSVPADGGPPQRLTNNYTNDGQPDVAADGTVAFRHGEDIWTMDLDGAHQAPLDTVPADLGFSPRWSPDGSMLALLRYDPSARATFEPRRGRPADLPLLDVVVVDLHTGGVTTVGPRVAADFNPVSWTPDSSALLIDRYDNGG